MNASITDIALDILPGDINSYRINQQKISDADFTNISHNKNALLGKTR